MWHVSGRKMEGTGDGERPWWNGVQRWVQEWLKMSINSILQLYWRQLPKFAYIQFLIKHKDKNVSIVYPLNYRTIRVLPGFCSQCRRKFSFFFFSVSPWVRWSESLGFRIMDSVFTWNFCWSWSCFLQWLSSYNLECCRCWKWKGM